MTCASRVLFIEVSAIFFLVFFSTSHLDLRKWSLSSIVLIALTIEVTCGIFSVRKSLEIFPVYWIWMSLLILLIQLDSILRNVLCIPITFYHTKRSFYCAEQLCYVRYLPSYTFFLYSQIRMVGTYKRLLITTIQTA